MNCVQILPRWTAILTGHFKRMPPSSLRNELHGDVLVHADKVVGAQPVEHLLQLGLQIGDLGLKLGNVHGVTPAQRRASQLCGIN